MNRDRITVANSSWACSKDAGAGPPVEDDVDAGRAPRPEEGHPSAAELAQTFGSLAAAARMEHMQWRMRVLGNQLEDVKKSMDLLRRKLPER